MKNTKELSIRLYIGTLYSNFIVPLRGSNYIQLLYGDLQQLLIFLLEQQIRWLVWQERINEVGQILVKTWSIKTQEGYIADTTELGKSTLKKICQRYPKGMPEFGKFNLKRLHQRYTKDTPKFGLFSFKPLLQFFSNTSPEIGTDRGKSGQLIRQECYQKRPNATRKQGDQRWQKSGIENCAQLRPIASRNYTQDYLYLILPGYLFMLCC